MQGDVYENETGKEIKYLAVMFRVDMETNKKWLLSKKMFRLYDSLVYKSYTGKELQDTEFTSEIRVKYFKKVKKTIKCVEDTVYVLM